MFGKPKYTIVKIKKKEMPGGLCTKCAGCGQIMFNKQLGENDKICPKCDHTVFTHSSRNYGGKDVLLIYCSSCGAVVGVVKSKD